MLVLDKDVSIADDLVKCVLASLNLSTDLFMSRSQQVGPTDITHSLFRQHLLFHLLGPAQQIPGLWGTVGASSSSTLSSPAPPLQSSSADPTDVGNSWHIIIIYIIIACTTSPVQLCRSHRCGEQLAHHHHLHYHRLHQLCRTQRCGEQLAHHHHLHYHRLHHLSSPALQIPQMLAWQIVITVILTVYIITHSNRHTSMLEHCKLAVLSNVNFPAFSLNPPSSPTNLPTSIQKQPTDDDYKETETHISVEAVQVSSIQQRCLSVLSLV